LPVIFLEPQGLEEEGERHRDQDGDVQVEQLAIERAGAILVELMRMLVDYAGGDGRWSAWCAKSVHTCTRSFDLVL
jgi:hypothetical protein